MILSHKVIMEKYVLHWIPILKEEKNSDIYSF